MGNLAVPRFATGMQGVLQEPLPGLAQVHPAQVQTPHHQWRPPRVLPGSFQRQPLHQTPQATRPGQDVAPPSFFMLIGVAILTHLAAHFVAKETHKHGVLISIFIAIGLVIWLSFILYRGFIGNLITHQSPLHPSLFKTDTNDLTEATRTRNGSIPASPPERVTKHSQNTEDHIKAQVATTTAMPLQVDVPGKPFDFGQKSYQIKARGNTVIVTLRGFRYNSYWGKPAALILFRFEFRRTSGGEPAQAGTIKVKFAGNGPTPSKDGPIVLVMFPKLLLRTPSPESHTREREFRAGLSGPATLPVVPRANAQETRQINFTREQRSRIDGVHENDKKNGPASVARWVMKANKVQKDGIPPEYGRCRHIAQ